MIFTYWVFFKPFYFLWSICITVLTTFISLGFNCKVKAFIDRKIVRRETHFFDYIGASMWAVNDLVRNKFWNGTDELFNREDYCNLEITKGTFINTNRKYYLRFLHDIKNISDLSGGFYSRFVDKMKRRAKRFIEFLDRSQRIVFIRLAESTNRIIYDEHKDKFKKTELEYVHEFAHILRKGWKHLDFQIILLSDEEETNIGKEVAVINCRDKISDFFKCDSEIYDQLKAHGVGDGL